MFDVSMLIGIGIGLVVGAFIPSVLRKIKGLFVKETTVIKTKL